MSDHKTSVVIRIVAWSAIAFVLLALLIGGLTDRIFRINFPFINFGSYHRGSGDYEYADRYIAGGGSVRASEIQQVDIEWIEGAITVLPGDGDEIVFSETSRYELAEEQMLHYDVQNGRLSIQYCAPRGSQTLTHPLGKSLTVTLPRELYLNEFNLEAASASVDLSGIRADDMNVEAVSGSVSIAEVACTSLALEVVSGKVSLSEISAGTLQVEGISGSVDILRSELGEVQCSLVSGKLVVEPGANVHSISADSISGTTRVILPEHTGFTARYSEGSGNFSCEFPVEMEGKHTAVYNGGGAEFRFETISGAIHIEKK